MSAPTNKVFLGDCRDVMRSVLAQGVKVQCCVTSPPYFGLRDYQCAGQLGLERTYPEYIANMVEVFTLVRELLADDGTLWLNMGDTYAANRSYQVPDNKHRDVGNARGMTTGSQHRDHDAIPRSDLRCVGLKPKDLCGIPWRLAFALQKPRYLGNIKREADRAWLAGLVDGEGCITILEATSPHGSGSSYPPILQIRMCDRECIDKAMLLTKSGGENPPQYPASMEGQRPAYQWRIHGRKAVDTIAEIYPFLLIKRKQAIVAWNHQLVREGYETKRGVKIPQEALEKQLLCRDLIQRLNRREPVDIPSWMKEPAQPFGPGWYLRQDVIWSKPNAMPESVTDRCTKAHEYLFLMTRSERYFYDAEAIKEPATKAGQVLHSYGTDAKDRAGASDVNDNRTKIGLANWNQPQPDTRNKRSVWTIPSQPYPEAHFATFPEALVEPCILAGSRPGDVVFDPFMGSGTVASVAQRLGRRWLGAELNPAYIDLIERRTRGTLGLELSA